MSSVRKHARVSVGALSCAIALLLLTAVSTVHTQTAPSPFFIEGTVTLTNNSGVAGFDIVNSQSEPPELNGSTKELGPINGSTTKIGVIDEDVVPTLAETNPNGSVDLNTVITQTHKHPTTGDQWYYFGYIKDSATGTGFVSIELQQSEAPEGCVYGDTDGDEDVDAADTALLISQCNPWANRTAGDVIFLFDFQGSGQLLIKRTFIEDVNNPGQVILPPCPQDFPTSETDECEAVDQSDFVASYGKLANGNIDRSRGEVAINLTNVLFGGSGGAVQCKNFANILPNTVTGNSDSADYKDTVLFPFEPISNCGQLTVTKVTQPEGLAGTFTFKISRPNDPDPDDDIFNGTIDSDCADDMNKQACEGTLVTPDEETSTVTIENLLAGTNYLLEEIEVEDNFNLLTIVCTLGETEVTVYERPNDAEGQVDPDGYKATFEVGTDGANTTCVITNGFVKTSPNATSTQRVHVFDEVTIKGLTPDASDRDIATVTIYLYADGTCTNLLGKTPAIALAGKYNGAGTEATVNSLSVGIDALDEQGSPTNGNVFNSPGGVWSWAFAYSGDEFNNPVVNSDTAKPTCNFESGQAILTEKTFP